jgi:hypothetical protein
MKTITLSIRKIDAGSGVQAQQPWGSLLVILEARGYKKV